MPTRGRQGPAGQARGEHFACGARLWPPGRVWRAIFGSIFGKWCQSRDLAELFSVVCLRAFFSHGKHFSYSQT